jgi:uncharacterized protein YbaA (DUF1428 family)
LQNSLDKWKMLCSLGSVNCIANDVMDCKDIHFKHTTQIKGNYIVDELWVLMLPSKNISIISCDGQL